MLLRRSLFLLDILVLLGVIVFLVLLPAERCMNFQAENTPDASKCKIHPVHHPEFSFTENMKNTEHLSTATHHVTVCHRLQWSHYSFWDNMYLILLPALTCVLLISYTLCELFEFELFVGTVQSTALIVVSVFSVIYTVGVISYEKNRIQTEWPLLVHAHILGAKDGETTVDVPKTWQYSIAMCLLSALFKIGRILIQHFIGDKKFVIDDVIPKNKKSEEHVLTSGNANETSGTTRMLNESRYSRIEAD